LDYCTVSDDSVSIFFLAIVDNECKEKYRKKNSTK
jgi:hypothetical protein